MWQGPAPDPEYHDNYLHYNWHWFWHWGTGELGNNGVHTIDIARWGLGVDYPVKVSSAGGRFRYDDDQETPDTNTVTYDFGGQTIIWEGCSWQRRGPGDAEAEIVFYGEEGTLSLAGTGYTISDSKGKEVAKGKGEGSDKPHTQNFLDGIRTGAKLNAEIEEGHKSTLLCHLGNIAYRTNSVLSLDPQTHQVMNNPAATALWSREYRPGWEPKV